ncbi:PilZ domain-containing protein [Erythrobacter sp.]|uniref:PilZ domain-containing protein n=1 Tax=Erythrobacter sp. TaxID=1042 RepID=UPI0025EBB54A|nr:PilZ domain-containing protein [Erythrobacter sp.]
MSDLGQNKAVEAMLEKRTSQRAATAASAIVLTNACRVDAAVADLSSGGAGLIGSTPPREGQEVQIRMGGHTLFGAVAWQKDSAFGVTFEDTLGNHDWSIIDEIVRLAEAEKRRAEQGLIPDELPNKCSDSD